MARLDETGAAEMLSRWPIDSGGLYIDNQDGRRQRRRADQHPPDRPQVTRRRRGDREHEPEAADRQRRPGARRRRHAGPRERGQRGDAARGNQRGHGARADAGGLPRPEDHRAHADRGDDERDREDQRAGDGGGVEAPAASAIGSASDDRLTAERISPLVVCSRRRAIQTPSTAAQASGTSSATRAVGGASQRPPTPSTADTTGACREPAARGGALLARGARAALAEQHQQRFVARGRRRRRRPRSRTPPRRDARGQRGHERKQQLAVRAVFFREHDRRRVQKDPPYESCPRVREATAYESAWPRRPDRHPRQ